MPLELNGTTGVQGNSGAFVAGTAVASTSGTSIDFTSIPSWVKRVTVMFSGVSTNGTSQPLVQVGNGSVVTSGYTSAFGDINGSNSCNFASATTGINFNGRYAGGAASAVYGMLILTLVGSNTWVALGNTTSNSYSYSGSGQIALSGALDRVRITTVNGTDTFDAGSINILYE